MRRIARLFVTALIVLVGLSAVAGPAVAAPEPAFPYRYSDCYEYQYDGDDYQVCLSGHGVSKFQQSASGQFLYKSSGTSHYTVTRNGEVIEEGSNKDNFVLVAKDETQVFHSNGRGQFSFAGATCTYKYNVTYANGELRHEAYDFQCSP
jgi:hypothetical protein